ncbi:6-carboxytetrahydropterin synthase @ Queuosine biosynthesis QueD, PTPS-I [invertebrate metagenome]|uniref:6-carboxytetrahydropterin synthase @ Queuosine biosynthesis QueD, PTPS-I n=1 Tax=invertebrate metagenome TaxID=1711999 RepID=A0A484H761_9ZZZZ
MAFITAGTQVPWVTLALSGVYTITRRIEIDAGHRVMTHGSKCRHLHGHRYTVEATCTAIGDRLHESGEQTDMVLDFGFLKEEMLNIIGASCDHGFIVALADIELLTMLAPLDRLAAKIWHRTLLTTVQEEGFCAISTGRLSTRLYIVPFQPTAERLARHWFERLAPAVNQRSEGLSVLSSILVWETPQSQASYTYAR